MARWDRSCFFSLSVFRKQYVICFYNAIRRYLCLQYNTTLSIFTVQYNVTCFYSAIRYLFLQCNTALSVFTVQYNVIYLYSAIQRYVFLQCNTLSVFTVQYNVTCFYSAIRYLFLQCYTTLLPRVNTAAVRMICSAKCRHHKMHANHEKSLNYNSKRWGQKSLPTPVWQSYLSFCL